MYYYPEQSSISEQSDAAVHSLGGQSFGRVELWVSMDCKKPSIEILLKELFS